MSFTSSNIIKSIYTCNGTKFYPTYPSNKKKAYTNSQVFYAFFSAFYSKEYYGFYDENQIPDRNEFKLDKSNTSNMLRGKIPLPKEIKQYYLEEYDEESYANDLQVIIPMLGIMADSAVKEIFNLLKEDESFPQIEKESFIQKFPEEKIPSGKIAYFFSAAFYSTFRNEYKPSSSKKTNKLIFNSPPPSCIDFCGRDNELKELHTLLNKHKKVFLYGVPGIGKSELAKFYACEKYPKNTVIMYISYSGNLKNDITKLQFPNDKQRDDEEKKFNNHYNFIKKLTPKDLLLIDNFNPGSNEDELFFEILSLQCNILFTTTMKFKDVHLMEVKRIETNDILFSWFNEKYIKNLAQKRIIQNIINALEGHTFATKIVSSLINDCCIEPSYILQKLSERNLLVDISDELEFGKDNLHKEATYTQHINALFSIFSLTTEQVTMMLQFCLFPSSGINGSVLKNLLNLKNMNIVNQLKKMGLIQKDSNGTFFIHSLTLEYILSKYKPSIENYYTLLESIQKIEGVKNFL